MTNYTSCHEILKEMCCGFPISIILLRVKDGKKLRIARNERVHRKFAIFGHRIVHQNLGL